MPWFRVDDTFPSHPKVMAAGNAAIGLWVRAGSWSMQQLTDGYIPTHVLPMLGKPVEARRLVDAGLWLEVEGGWRFHNWDERQPSKEQLEGDRNAARERQKRARERAKSQRESRRNSQRSSPVSHGPPIPSHPEVPNGTSMAPDSQASPADKPAKRAKQLPTDWQPSEAHRRLAAERGVDASWEADKFRDWAASNGTTKKDWEATFRNWLRNAKPSNNAPPPNTVRYNPDGSVDEASLPPPPPKSPFGGSA